MAAPVHQLASTWAGARKSPAPAGEEILSLGEKEIMGVGEEQILGVDILVLEIYFSLEPKNQSSLE